MDQPEPATRPAYRVREIASLLSVDVSTVYRWIDKGSLIAYRYEDTIRIEAADFDAFKRNSRIPHGPKTDAAHCCASQRA